MQTDDELQLNLNSAPDYRNVTSTAKLFNFRRPVYMSISVWEDCVKLNSGANNKFDELIVLQRLRHVLFMAASAMHGRFGGFEQEFTVYRVVGQLSEGVRKPEPLILKLMTRNDEQGQSVYVICLPDE